MARVYISSTYVDLAEYRGEVYKKLKEQGHQVVAMEDYAASDVRPLDQSRRDIDQCEVYLGILAWHYGYRPEDGNPEGKSITELEYEYALARQKPCLLFLLDVNEAWRGQNVDKGEDFNKLWDFRARLSRKHLCQSFFARPSDLAQKAVRAIADQAGIFVRQHLEVSTEVAPESSRNRGYRIVATEVAPEIRPEIKPESMVGPAAPLYLNPGEDLIVDPEVITEVAPEIKPEIKPRVIVEVAPPEVKPEAYEEGNGEGEARHFNTFFTAPNSTDSIPSDQALVHGQAYGLFVEISPKRRGLGNDDAPFPDAAIREALKDHETLPITVWAASRDFEIRLPQIQTLQLPFRGSSDSVLFAVIPRLNEGRGTVTVNLYFKGHLLQSKRIEAVIVPAVGVAVPAGLRLAQTARVTFTTSQRFDPEELYELPGRLITIDVAHDPRDGSIDFRFLDRSRGDEQLYFSDTVLQPAALGAAVERVRRQLKASVRGLPNFKGYEWLVEGDEQMLTDWLPRLAEAGRQLYEALFPKPGQAAVTQKLEVAMEAATVIQVNPIFGRTTIPWALLYEQRIKYVPGRIRLCSQRVPHKPHEACPDQADPYVVCPYGFWGYRYAIEQLPCWVSDEAAPLPTLVRSIDNTRPLNLNLNVWRDFPLWRNHSKKIEEAGDVSLLVAEETGEMEKIWAQNNPRLDVVYFYCHGGTDDLLGPYLQLSDAPIGSQFLRASNIDWARRPIVFLNGCATGDYGPEDYLNLIDDFRDAGASGVVGTECPVPELFAKSYAAELFPRLFRAERLGEAMLSTRLHFLQAKKNPLGLVYTLYAPHEVALSRAVRD